MSEVQKYLRFSISDRIEHWVQMVSFATLGMTGLAQKFSSSPISIWFIALLGGIETIRIIHRIASIGLMLGTIYHLGTAGYKYYVKRSRITMLPNLNDIKAAWGFFLHNLRLRKKKPQQGRYTFDEKFEYWAFVWGTLVMGLTGFILWNPIITAKYLPGIVIPAAKAAHSGEALLAVLAIIIWHFYNVHIKHINKSMFTGYLTEHEMLEEHPLELADIKAGIAKIPQDPEEVYKRKRIFFPVYAVVAYFMIIGVYFFVAGEETAIATSIDAEEVEIFVPLTPTPLPTLVPTPTPEPDAGKSWEAGIEALMIDRCGTCHAATVLGGLDLSTYQSAIAGGSTVSAIIPGDIEGSYLIQVQNEGDHPGQFSEVELDLVKSWIESGAPEQ
jgi:cytochrome b subunit of formate dehydrogenase